MNAQQPREAVRPALRGAAWFGLYLLLAVVATWPLARDAADHVYGLGTPPLNVWAMGFVQHQLPRAPGALFDGNAFYPYRHSLAFSEHLFVPALLAWPVSALSSNLVLGHNLVALLSLALAGLGMQLLARELCGDTWSASAAGVLYAFHTWNVNELIRLQILSNQWFPFLLLLLVRYFKGPSWRGAWLAACAYLAQSLSCMYWMLYAPLVAGAAFLALQARARLAWRELVPLALALGMALVLMLPFTWPYVATARELGLGRGLPDAVGVERWLDVLPGNHLYASWLGTARANQDAAHFLGFLAMVLAALGAWRGRFAPGIGLGRLALVALALGGLLLSLGPEIRIGAQVLAPGPYRLLYLYAPGFHNVRYPERFALVALLGLAPLAAAGLASLRSWLWPGGGRRSKAFALTAALAVFGEHFSAPLDLERLPPASRLPGVYAWLGQQADVHVVAEVPASRYQQERADALPMYHSTAHWKRTVQGFTGYFPPAYNFVRWRLHRFPEPETLLFLERFGVDTVVVGPDLEAPLPDELAARLSPAFPEGQRVLRLPARARPEFDEPRAPDPAWRKLARDGWSARGSYPGAERALDGDAETAWATERDQGRGDFFRVAFPRPLVLTRVRLATSAACVFPVRLKLLGETADEGAFELPYDERAAYDGLVALLLRRPRQAALVLDVSAPRQVQAVRLRVAESDSFGMPWDIAEFEAWERPQPNVSR